jgi:hypothetical protein
MAPCGPSAKFDDDDPVSAPRYPIVIVVGVTPTSLAWLPAPPVPDAPLLVPAVDDAVVAGGEELFDELPQPAASTAATPTTATARFGILTVWLPLLLVDMKNR